MGEICELIREVREDKEKFYLVMEQFEPLINKYVRLLYRDEKEDVYAEFMKALWEAVLDIKYYDNDGQVIRFISIAMKNKYLELYRASRKYHDNMVGIDDEMEITMDADNPYDDILLQESMNKIYSGLNGNKKEIFKLIFFEGFTDIEVSSKLKISRQYIHRIRKNLYDVIKKEIVR